MLSTPYANNVTRHPVFARDIKGARWAWPREQFRRKSLRLLLLTHVGMIVIWLALSLLWYLDIMRVSYYAYIPLQAWYNGASNAFSLLVLGAILAGVALDFNSVQASLNTISGEMAAGRWDLLRLTALREEGIVNAKYAAAQLRGWRLMTIVVSARVSVLTIFLLFILILPYFIYGYNSFLRGFFDSLIYDPLSTLIGLATFVLTCLVFVLEPLWRMKTMTALGMAVSAQVLNPALATLAGIGSVLAVWLAQTVIAASLGAGMALFSPIVFFPFASGSAVIASLFVLLACVVTSATILGFYHLLQSWALRRVMCRIFKFDSLN